MEPGHHFCEGKYTINSLYHEGPTCKIFLITTLLNVTHILKLFKRSVPNEEFQKELNNCRILGVEQNLDFITYISSSEDDNILDKKYIVFEFAEKGSLDEYLIAQMTLTEKEKKILFLQIVKIIQDLHLLHYYHLDISLKNIFVNQQFHFKLGDFGSTKYFLNQNAESEIAEKDDIKSLGILLLDLIAGKQNLENKKKIWALIEINKPELKLSQDFIDLINSMIDDNYENRPDFQTIYDSAYFDDIRDEEDFHDGLIELQDKLREIDSFLHP